MAEDEAVVSLFDRAYQVGVGAFATLRAYRGRCFRADRHVAQLARAAEVLGIALPASAERIAAIADDAAARSGADDARVRITLSDTAFSIVAEAADVPGADDYARGVVAVTVSARRISPACFDGTLKTTSYAPAMLAQREARARGAAEGVQLGIGGELAGGTVSNLFVLRGDELATPSLESGCRAGVTRDAVLEIAPRLGLRAFERIVVPDEIFVADAAFFTSSRIECLPIRELDGRALPSVSASRFPEILAAFRDLVARETAG